MLALPAPSSHLCTAEWTRDLQLAIAVQWNGCAVCSRLSRHAQHWLEGNRTTYSCCHLEASALYARQTSVFSCQDAQMTCW